MKGLLIIDDKEQEINVASFEVSYHKYNQYDTVITVSTEEYIESQVSVKVPVVEAVGIDKPSSRGIVDEPIGEVPVKDSLKGESFLEEARRNAGIKIINSFKPSDTYKMQTNIEIGEWLPDDYLQAIAELVKKEFEIQTSWKELGDVGLYISKIPVFVSDITNQMIKVKESVCVYQLEEEGNEQPKTE